MRNTDFDFHGEDCSCALCNDINTYMNNFNWHSVKMFTLIIASILSAGIAVIYPNLGVAPMWISLLSNALTVYEHANSGNTGSPVTPTQQQGL